MQRIDRASPQKLYLQLATIIEEQIATQVIPAGEQLPTEDQLCRQFEVSKAVVRHAMEHLSTLGYIKKIAGKGTFVLRNTPRRGTTMTLALEDPVLDGGLTLQTRVLTKTVTVPPPGVAARFGPMPPRQVFKLARLFLRGETPVMLETAYLSDEACPGMTVLDFRHRALPEVMERQVGVGIGRVTLAVESVLLGGGEADSLQMTPGHAAVQLERNFFDREDRLLGLARALCPAGEHRLTLELLRLHG